MKRVYIAHPLRGAYPHTKEKVTQNTKDAAAICMMLSAAGNIIPFSPIHAFSYMDALECDQRTAMQHCFALLDSCDEIWVFGDWRTSAGCRTEIDFARKKGMPIRFMDGHKESS